MVLKTGVTDLQVLGVPESLVPELREQAELFSTEDLLRIFDALLKTEDELKDATNPRFQLEMGLIELAQLPRVRSLETLIAEFSALVKGNLPEPSGTGTRPAHSAASAGGESSLRGRARKEDSSARSFDTQSGADKSSEPVAPSPVEQLSGQELLQRIAGAVQKESLESALRALPGAELKDDSLMLDLTRLNEFFRRQIKENVSLIAQAASEVAGRPIRISFPHELGSPAKAAAAAPPLTDIMERVRREPLVQSFLDRFPGPVKAEEIDS
jgi:DNA polymerase III gamma/tau subunit